LKLPFSGLPRLLSENNYKTHFLHGGDALYDDMRLLVQSENPVDVKDAADIREYKFKNKWGVDDESFYKFSGDYIKNSKGKNFYCILSMSNHEPYELPGDFPSTRNLKGLLKAEKGFLYSDHALGTFIRDLKKSGAYGKSLIIITADHGESYAPVDDETKRYHVPLLIIDHRARNTSNPQPCSHADVAEFILQKTGYKGNSHFLGLGLAGKPGLVFYRDYEDNIYKVTDSVIYRYNIRSAALSKLHCSESMYVQKRTPLAADQKEAADVIRNIQSCYTSFRYLFENGLYRPD
jgi:phosphoglycerol transferase MdoB-like AlkP superfamily enzyme